MWSEAAIWAASKRWRKALRTPKYSSRAIGPRRDLLAVQVQWWLLQSRCALPDVHLTTNFWLGCSKQNATTDPGKPTCVEATSWKLICCLYETSHRAGGTKRSNQETITSGNAIVGFYFTSWFTPYIFLPLFLSVCLSRIESDLLSKNFLVFKINIVSNGESHWWSGSNRNPQLWERACSTGKAVARKLSSIGEEEMTPSQRSIFFGALELFGANWNSSLVLVGWLASWLAWLWLGSYSFKAIW